MSDARSFVTERRREEKSMRARAKKEGKEENHLRNCSHIKHFANKRRRSGRRVDNRQAMWRARGSEILTVNRWLVGKKRQRLFFQRISRRKTSKAVNLRLERSSPSPSRCRRPRPTSTGAAASQHGDSLSSAGWLTGCGFSFPQVLWETDWIIEERTTTTILLFW